MRLRRLLVLLAATLLVLSGCGGSPEPKPMPKPSSTAASPSPTPPAMPSAAKQKTKRGAIALGRYYVALVNHAQATGDVKPLASIEAQRAPSCARSRLAVKRIYAAGGEIRGGAWRVRSVSALPNPTTHGWLIALTVAFGPQSVRRSASAEPQHLQGGRLPINLQIANERGEWRVRECTRGA